MPWNFFRMRKAKPFTADRIHTDFETKKLRDFIGDFEGRGSDAFVNDIIVFKKNHKSGLIIKDYKNTPKQNKFAEADIYLFDFFKRNGIPTPPTIRKFNWGKTNYVAMSDLSKFGDVQFHHFSGDYAGIRTPRDKQNLKALEKLMGSQRFEQFFAEMHIASEKVKKLTGEAPKDFWEIVVDTKKKEARFFALDMAQYHKFYDPLLK